MFKRIMGVVLLAVAMPIAYAQATPAAKQQTQATASSKKSAGFDASGCFGCHAPIKEFHDSGKHKGLACTSCHSGIENHLSNPSNRPVTSTDPATCGACHKNQFDTAYQMDWQRTGRFEKKQMTGPSPNPSFDLLMTPHGFTREHNLPRSHAFVVLDQFVVDRAFRRPIRAEGQLALPGQEWRQLQGLGRHPGQLSRKHRPEAVQAGHRRGCESGVHLVQDAGPHPRVGLHGRSGPGAKWSRTSKVVEMAKSVNHANNCFFCHDPHAAKPRVVRDALIQALTRKDFPTLYTRIRRKRSSRSRTWVCAAIRARSRCSRATTASCSAAQCHVEYNCNPGIDPKTGAADRDGGPAHQHVPVWSMSATSPSFYDSIKFRDFRHLQTGALLTKRQHPDSEMFWNSKHDKAGVQCASCHMPKVTDPKTKKTYTSHWQTNPKHYIKETCLTCHTDWNAEQAKYVMESMYVALRGQGTACRVLAGSAD